MESLFRVHQQIGVLPFLSLAGEEGDLVLAHTHIPGNGLLLQRQFCDPGHIIQTGIVAAGVPAVGIGEVRPLEAQFLCHPVHLADEGLHCLGGSDFLVAGNLPSRSCGQNNGCVIATGEHHALHQHPHIQTVVLTDIGKGGTGMDQIHLVAHGDHVHRIQILQRHIGGEQFGHAGGIELVAFPGVGEEDLVIGRVIDQQLIIGHLHGHFPAELINPGLRVHRVHMGLHGLRFRFLRHFRRCLRGCFGRRFGRRLRRRLCGCFRSGRRGFRGLRCIGRAAAQQQGHHKNRCHYSLNPYSHDYPPFSSGIIILT